MAEEKENIVAVEEEEKKEKDMKPWEQHSAVISIPRYDYRAPSSLLERSHSGFLITCPIKREKSATKEAICILEEYVVPMSSNRFKRLEPCCMKISTKKRKISPKQGDEENIETTEENEAGCPETSGTGSEGAISASSEISANLKSNLNLSLVKLTRSGLLLFAFPNNDVRHVVDVLTNMCLSLGSRNLKQPLWCHRIFPIQETCISIEDLNLVVSKLTREFLGNGEEKLESPIKFAVGYNRRGIEETEIKNLKSTANDAKGLTLLDRDRCIKVVAGAFKGVAKNSVVDLNSPEVAVLVELLPLSGVAHESIVVGVSILPRELIITKPRLCVKPLVSEKKGN